MNENTTDPQIMSSAFLDAQSKMEKIRQFGLTAETTIEEQDKIVEDLATAKAFETGGEVKDYRKGQAQYIEYLVKFAGMTGEQRLDYCYKRKFADIADTNQMIAALSD